MINKLRFSPVYFFAILATILISVWFRFGHLYGGGDVGIPSYNPSRILEIARYVWWDVSAPGVSVPQGLTSVPFQFFQSSMQKIGFPPVAIQALFFWIILFFSGWGMYLVGKDTFGKEKSSLSLLVGFFYLFNPYMMIQIWHRFIHNTMFLMAGLPFFYIYFRKWIMNGKFFNLLIFLIINSLFVYIFGTLAFILTILFLLFYTVIFEIFIPWKNFNYLRKIGLRFFICIFFLLLIHLWWILPVFKIIPFAVSTQHSTASNLSTLISISKQAIIPFSILGINPFYLYNVQDFGEIYSTGIFLLLPWLILIFLIPGFFISLVSKKYIFWPLLWLISIFLVKGTSTPFGFIYEFIFSKFFVLGVIRNPYEKLGILLPFSSAILITFGIKWFLDYDGQFKTSLRSFISVIIIMLTVIFLWPIWTGKLFGVFDKPAFIEIPEDYKKADEIINDISKEGRILHLPLTSGEGASYRWEYGYSGVESSQLYFSSLPSISRGFSIEYVDNSLNSIIEAFNNNNISEQKILKLLEDFDVKVIVLHKDIIWEGGSVSNPNDIEIKLDKLTFLTGKKEVGNLIIYKIADKFLKNKLILSSNIQYLIDNYKSPIIPYLLREDDLGEFMSSIDGNADSRLFNTSSEVIVTPKDSWLYYNQDLPIEQIINELPSVRIPPDVFFYPLIRLKEETQLLGTLEKKGLILKVTLAGKRLEEAYKLKKQSTNQKIIPTLKIYQNLLDNIFKTSSEDLRNAPSIGSRPLIDIFTRHLSVLKHLQDQEKVSPDEYQYLNLLEKSLRDYLKNARLLPLYDLDNLQQKGFSFFHIIHFEIPDDGEFELVLNTQDSENVYPDKFLSLNLEIDGQVVELRGEKKENSKFISYGKLDLTKGIHELIIPMPYSDNLIKTPDNVFKGGQVLQTGDQFEVNSGNHGASFVEAEINPLSPNTWYEISFESWIKKGDKFRVELIQDTDPPDPKNPGQTIKDYDKSFSKDIYNNYWKEYKFSVMPKSLSNKSSVRLLVGPWDDCEMVVVKKIFCKDKQFRKDFEHEAIVLFKNFKITRLMGNPLFLYSEKENSIKNQNYVGEITEFERKSPVLYEGKIRLENPGYIIFKESYHPNWQLELTNGNTKYIPSDRYIANGYSNAWFVGKQGSYLLKLEFKSQNYLYKGLIVSIIGVIIIIALAIRERRMK